MPALAERFAVARTVAWSACMARLGRVNGDRSNASSERVGANNARGEARLWSAEYASDN